MIDFREFYNSLCLKTIDNYGEERSKELRNSILNMLSVSLKKYLYTKVSNRNSDYSDLSNYLITTTKNYLVHEFRSGTFEFDKVDDEDVQSLIDSFNNDEKQVWLLVMIYDMSGYDKNKSKEVREGIRILLGIPQLKYKLICLKLAMKLIKNVRRASKELYSLLDDEDKKEVNKKIVKSIFDKRNN